MAGRIGIGCSRMAGPIGRSRPRRRASSCRPGDVIACAFGRRRRLGRSRSCALPRSATRDATLGFVSAQGELRHVLRIGIDVGGTFTDLVAVDAQGRVTLAKAASTPRRPVGRRDGRPRPAGGGARYSDRAAMLSRTERIVHGTTVATNALLEHKGAKVGLLTTEGHRDILEMREGLKDDRYNLRQPPPMPARAARTPARRARAYPAGWSRRDRARARLRSTLRSRPEEPGRGGRCHLLPPQLARCEPRAHDRRGRARGDAGRLRLPLLGGAASDQGVRSRSARLSSMPTSGRRWSAI